MTFNKRHCITSSISVGEEKNMGLFGKKEKCCVCNQNEGVKKISTGMICNNCFKKVELFIGVFD